MDDYYKVPQLSFEGENFQIRTMILCESFPSGLDYNGVSILTIPLDPISNWLSIGSVKIFINAVNTIVHHENQPNREYESVGRRIYLNSISKLRSQNCDRAEIEEKFELKIYYDEPQSMDIAQKDYIEFCDFIYLLTDQDVMRHLPKVEFSEMQGELIYWREFRPEKELERFKHWVNFGLIDADFGKLFDRYQELAKNFKSGFYLYFAAQRAEKIYEEHRFFNYVSGLESFHREMLGDLDVDQEIVERIKRITVALAGVNSINSEDNEWLIKKLEFSTGSTLNKRLSKIFKRTRNILEYEGAKIESFIKKCVENRDLIAHRGGPVAALYKHFFDEIERLSGALRVFYVVNILLEIGITAEVIKKSIAFNQRNAVVLPAFRDAGLIKQSEPQTPASSE